MSDNIEYVDVDHDDFADTPRALREHVRKIQDRLKQTMQERDTFKGQATSAALSGVLKGFKNPERVQRDLVSDNVDPLNTSAVEKWLSENGADYAKGDAAPPQEPDSIPDAEKQAHQQINDGASLRSPADMSKLEAAIATLPPNHTGADLIRVYKEHGL